MTRALVQDANGWRYRGGAVGDRHVFSKKTDYESTDAVNTIVDRELVEATVSARTVSIGGEFVPRAGDPAPFASGMNVGDAVNAPGLDRARSAHRLVSWRVSESTLGTPAFSFELNNIFEDEASRQARWLEQATPGTLAGRADSVGSVSFGSPHPFRKASTQTVLTINAHGYLMVELDEDDPEDEGHSDRVEIDQPLTAYKMLWSLEQAGDTATIVQLRHNGTVVHYWTIPAGVRTPTGFPSVANGMYTNLAMNKGDAIQYVIYQAGDYAAGLVVKLCATTQS